MTAQDPHLSALLERANDGDRDARDELLESIYSRLRELARNYLRGERPGHTLETTALVHEAYVRILQGTVLPGRNRSQLLAFIAQALRHILVDHARRRGSRKRGGGRKQVPLTDTLVISPEPDERLVALDGALRRLAKIDERKSRVVELRFFAGLGVEEVAEILETSVATVKRDWQAARAWLFDDLTASESRDDGSEAGS